jgi:hypothetical protein
MDKEKAPGDPALLAVQGWAWEAGRAGRWLVRGLARLVSLVSNSPMPEALAAETINAAVAAGARLAQAKAQLRHTGAS